MLYENRIMNTDCEGKEPSMIGQVQKRRKASKRRKEEEKRHIQAFLLTRILEQGQPRSETGSQQHRTGTKNWKNTPGHIPFEEIAEDRQVWDRSQESP